MLLVSPSGRNSTRKKLFNFSDLFIYHTYFVYVLLVYIYIFQIQFLGNFAIVSRDYTAACDYNIIIMIFPVLLLFDHPLPRITERKKKPIRHFVNYIIVYRCIVGRRKRKPEMLLRPQNQISPRDGPVSYKMCTHTRTHYYNTVSNISSLHLGTLII